MGEVVKLNPGNGAREAMIAALEEMMLSYWDEPAKFADQLLGQLWVEGFKVVPLEPEDE